MEESRAIRNNLQDKVVVSAEMLISVAGSTYLAPADLGTCATLASYECVRQGKENSNEKKTTWKTQAGKFATKATYVMQGIMLPQFTTRRKFHFNLHRFKNNLE